MYVESMPDLASKTGSSSYITSNKDLRLDYSIKTLNEWTTEVESGERLSALTLKFT
jgi:hypothetical protein